MIAHIYGHNTSTYNPEGETVYDYELYEVNKGGEALKYGKISHTRTDGIFQLIKKICAES